MSEPIMMTSRDVKRFYERAQDLGTTSGWRNIIGRWINKDMWLDTIERMGRYHFYAIRMPDGQLMTDSKQGNNTLFVFSTEDKAMSFLDDEEDVPWDATPVPVSFINILSIAKRKKMHVFFDTTPAGDMDYFIAYRSADDMWGVVSKDPSKA